ncbi:MAG TPA: CDP-alcohol phosphatidyltransferase family protein [Vicinamibacterales bacterium]|jgi:phosphatidylglycerophosphate synthase|nr:CDP-alcohol phosphatidyltransferase family protein [Vicinamibacterales bacterium]
MFERAPALGRISDAVVRAPLRVLHVRLGVTPTQITWATLVVSVAAAAAIAGQRVGTGLILMAVGQVLDAMDGGMAREFNLVSESGKKLDEWIDRASETAIFLGFAAAGTVPVWLVALSLVAIGLLTTISHRSRFDLGFKRFPLYFGLWLSYTLIFKVIFFANVVSYVVGLLIIDCQFQVAMDKLGGDLDTVASRAAALEETVVEET